MPQNTAASQGLRRELGGVQIHAAHGFLQSQFLSKLFNNRIEELGCALANHMCQLLASREAI